MLPSRKYYLDSIFDNFMDSPESIDIMKCDVYEKEGAYYIEADIPGFKKEAISVECEDDYVTISTPKTSENKEESNDKYSKRERFYGTTTRKFYVGEVDSEKIKAELKNGILRLVLPNKKSIEIE